MISIKFLPQAIEELDDSIQYYEELYKSLGLDFHKEVKKTIKIIALNPKIWNYMKMALGESVHLDSPSKLYIY